MVKRSSRVRIRVPVNTFEQNWKVELGSDTITSDLMSLNVTSQSLRYGIGSFTVLLYNEKGQYNDRAVVGKDVTVYFHQASSVPTNKLFVGKMDKPSYGLTASNRFHIILSGRDFPELADKKITINFAGSQADNAIKSIIDTHFSGVFTYTNLDPNMTGTVDGDYVDQKAITVIGDILRQVEYDGYIDGDRDIHTTPDDGTNRNAVESIVHGINMLPFTGFGRDGLKEFNEVKCYGDQSEDMILFRRKIDQPSISESWVKTAIVNAKSLLTPASVAARASSELADLKRSTVSGFLSAEAGLPTLKVSQYFWASAQYADIGDYYKAIKVNHVLDSRGKTTVNVSVDKPMKSAVSMIRVLDNSINSQNRNPNAMDDTLIYLTFDNEDGITSLGDLEIANGRLRVKAGKSTGTMTTDVTVADSNLSQFEVRGKVNDDCSVSTFKVINTGGASYNDDNTEYNLVGGRDTAVVFTTEGKRIRATVTLTKDANNPAPELSGLSVLARRV